jgi:hypothetical protein
VLMVQCAPGVGGYLTANKTAYFEQGLKLVKELTTAHSSPAVRMIHANVGRNVTFAALKSAFQGRATFHCNNSCFLSEVGRSGVLDAPLTVFFLSKGCFQKAAFLSNKSCFLSEAGGSGV